MSFWLEGSESWPTRSAEQAKLLQSCNFVELAPSEMGVSGGLEGRAITPEPGRVGQ